MTSDQNRDNQIKNIMRWFGWKKVQKTMKLLKWAWFDNLETPDVPRLKSTAERLLRDVWALGEARKRYVFIGSGGFTARYEYYPDGSILSLDFNISDWRYEYPEDEESQDDSEPIHKPRKITMEL